jgi:glycosyltransferase involved in cell wall biosynthesis
MFNFIPKQPATRIPEFMAASDAAFLSLTDSPLFAMTIPAKLQSYMACGIPNIVSAAGETAKIIKESNSGLCGRPGNAEELADNIINLANKSKEELIQLGDNARKYYEENFDKKALLDRMDLYFGLRAALEDK